MTNKLVFVGIVQTRSHFDGNPALTEYEYRYEKSLTFSIVYGVWIWGCTLSPYSSYHIHTLIYIIKIL